MMKIHYAWILLAMTALAGCRYEGMGIQKQYKGDRQECREFAEEVVGGSYGPEGGETHIDLVNAFAGCMKKRGWAVNQPKEDEEKK